MSDGHDLDLLLKSQIPIIVIESYEETRLLQLISRIGLQQYKPVYMWSITDGLKRIDIDLGNAEKKADETEVLWKIREQREPGIYILCDYHPFLDEPLHVRLIKDIALAHEQTQISLVLLSHRINLPNELSRMTARAELSIPSPAELEKIVMEIAGEWRRQNKTSVQASKENFQLLIRGLSGLTTADAIRLARTAIFDDGTISADDIPQVVRAKHSLLQGDDILSFEFDTSRFSEVGGLHNLKNWLNQRKPSFHGELDNKALDALKGVLLLGVQGGGKSLAAKATAGLFQVPLLRLDFATIYNKYHGETERNLREALRTAEAMSPCVLWIDEIEKGLSTGSNDGGTSQRVLGTLLTWMAERKAQVFLVATANDIERLPAELVRKGRFDEIFFIDLPDANVRREIFSIHLDKRDLNASTFDLDLLAEESGGFSGAEIEQAIVSALYATHHQGRPMETMHILDELCQTRPLSVVMQEKVDYLRQWASERTVPAS